MNPLNLNSNCQSPTVYDKVPPSTSSYQKCIGKNPGCLERISQTITSTVKLCVSRGHIPSHWPPKFSGLGQLV